MNNQEQLLHDPIWMDQGFALMCLHSFHSQCLTRWVSEKKTNGIVPTCPNCRKAIDTDVRSVLFLVSIVSIVSVLFFKLNTCTNFLFFCLYKYHSIFFYIVPFYRRVLLFKRCLKK